MPSQVTLKFDGEVLTDEATPQEMDMEDEDQIDAKVCIRPPPPSLTSLAIFWRRGSSVSDSNVIPLWHCVEWRGCVLVCNVLCVPYLAWLCVDRQGPLASSPCSSCEVQSSPCPPTYLHASPPSQLRLTGAPEERPPLTQK